jgi:hypothetical protein
MGWCEKNNIIGMTMWKEQQGKKNNTREVAMQSCSMRGASQKLQHETSDAKSTTWEEKCERNNMQEV